MANSLSRYTPNYSMQPYIQDVNPEIARLRHIYLEEQAKTNQMNIYLLWQMGQLERVILDQSEQIKNLASTVNELQKKVHAQNDHLMNWEAVNEHRIYDPSKKPIPEGMFG